MRAIVVYDSRSRNCERLAQVIAAVLDDVPVAASEADVMDVEAADLVVVGGSARRHGLAPQLDAFFDRLPAEGLRGLQAAAFATRMPGSHLLGGSAAVKIARALRRKGALLVAPPESFRVVVGGEHLAKGELERTRKWAVQLVEGAGDLARQRAVGGELSSLAPHGVLRHAGAHLFPAAPITIRWSGTKVPEPDEEQGESAGRR